MKILLINPKFPPSYWGQEYTKSITGFNYVFPPLGLATVAALSKGHHVEIIDENIEVIDFDYAKQFDVIGITGYMIQSNREFEICDTLKEIGCFVVIGGPNAYLIQEECEKHCDVIIKGEAEKIWPQFLKDFENNSYKEIYEDEDKIIMNHSPIPRFDLLKLKQYTAGIIQTTRGCPHTCDFCDIIVIYGRKVRLKPVSQIIEEIDILYKMGKTSIFVADDNFVGNRRHAKEVLRAIKKFNHKIGNKLSFYTQVSMQLAKDDTLLKLMHECRFEKVFIGIETPRKSSLNEANKGYNAKVNLLDDIRHIQSYNILIMAGMIVGFDNDDDAIFQEQVDFLQSAGIPYAMVGTLQAIPHTPLYHRLEKEKRLVNISSGNNFATTNIIPKLMNVKQLVEGYIWLSDHLYSAEQFTKRVLKNISYFKKKTIPVKLTIRFNDLKILARTIIYSFFHWNHLKNFIKMTTAIIKKSPTHLSQVIAMYLGFIHMSRYIKKHKPTKTDIDNLVSKVKNKLSKIEDRGITVSVKDAEKAYYKQ